MASIVDILGEEITWDTEGKTDVYPLLEDAQVRNTILTALCERVNHDDIDYVVAPEATGMVFGSALADRLGLGFLAVRRKDKWPFTDDDLHSLSCEDYSNTTKTFAVRNDQLSSGDRVLFFDDWIETGGQYTCIRRLIETTGATVTQSLVVAIETSPATDGLRDRVDSLLTIE